MINTEFYSPSNPSFTCHEPEFPATLCFTLDISPIYWMGWIVPITIVL